MRATVSADLLATIFSPYSPLHDGAVLVRGEEIVGRRLHPAAHAESARATARSARGTARRSDSPRRPTRWCWSCPEESAIVSLARAGALQRGLTPEQVRAALRAADGDEPQRG